MTDPRKPSLKIEIRALTAKATATQRDKVARDEISEALGRMYQAVNAAVARQGVELAGAPFARYHEFGSTVDLEAGFPVKPAIQLEGGVKPGQLPGGPAATSVHVGPYEELKATYDAIEAWMQSSGRSPNGGPWEIYLTDPTSEPDPRKWLTQVVWPVKLS